MTVLAVIPARKGSKRLPGKNLQPLYDMDREHAQSPLSLLDVAVATALLSPAIDDVVVTTDLWDDERLFGDFRMGLCHKVAPSRPNAWQQVHFRRRPDKLCTDTAEMSPVLKDALEFYERKTRKTASVVVLLQPTSPFRSFQTLRCCVDLAVKNGLPVFHCLEFAHKLQRFDRVTDTRADRMYVIDRNNLTAVVSGNCYAWPTLLLRESGDEHLWHFMPYCTPGVPEAIDIDEYHQLAVARYLVPLVQKEKGFALSKLPPFGDYPR